MIQEYIEYHIIHALNKSRILRGKIINPSICAEFTGLQSRCECRLDEITSRLQYLLNDTDIKKKENSARRIRLLRRAVEGMSLIECTGIAALNRPNADDVLLNKIVFNIHKEINYPLNPPTVTCLSQSYYVIYPSIGLLAVPLAEADSLLHLPDLYHELAHPVISAIGDPKTEGIQKAFNSFNENVSIYYEKRNREIARQTGPREYSLFVSNIFKQCWIKYWSMEFFCDLFAAFTLGPAYAWSHLHLTAKREADPHAVKEGQMSSHPPDHARMEVIIQALKLLGFEIETKQIWEAWSSLLKLTGSQQEPSYRKACPNELLEHATICALEGVRAIKCRLAGNCTQGNTYKLLNDAWTIFWNNPSYYLEWEREKIQFMRDKI